MVAIIGRGGAYMSVRKRTWTTATGEEREAWLVDYRDQNGYRAARTFDKKGEAVDFWATVKVDVGRGDHVVPAKSETIEQVAKRWINRVEGAGREPTTVRQYRQHIDLHIVPRIGQLKVASLTETRLEAFRDSLLTGDKKLSRALARKVLVSVKSILRTAKRGHIAANVKIDRDKRQRKLEAGTDIPTPAEISRLLKAAERFDLRRRALLATVIFTGLRSSELLGLRWSDVDFKHAFVHVRQRADRKRNIGAPKSEAGTRKIDIGPRVVAMLKEWKVACPKDGELGLVFPTKAGEVAHNKNTLASLAPVMKAAGLVDKEGEPKYGLHSLRHYFASWCINPVSAGGRELPPKNVQGLLGHSSITMTMDTYGHLFPTGNDRAALADAEAKLWG
jgi:integrase